MIFLTVGTGKFDELVEEVDKIAAQLNELIIFQIGNGSYVPKGGISFRFQPNIEKYCKDSRLVITHGGAGTIYSLLKQNKKVIAVANYDRTDNHQQDILKALSSDNFLIWCKDPSKVSESIKQSETYKFEKYTSPKCNISKKIGEYLNEL